MSRTVLYLLAIMMLPQAVAASVLVGKTEGTFSVSPTGAATYTIPINVQKGMSDFAPDISLSYNSQAGNGIAGIGWGISGLSSISIVPRNCYFDGQAEAIYTGDDNAYALDGMRLLLVSGTNGSVNATYRTENEQYSVITITNALNGTPATFQVRAADGTTYRYGSSTGRYTLSNGETYQWALDYAQDVLGNYISYSYSQEGGLYPTSVTYGRNVHGTAGVECTVSFNYESRPDSIPSYVFGYRSFLKKRLKSIECRYSGNLYRTYTLNYSEDSFSRLVSVTEAGRSSATLRPTVFEWNVPSFQVSCNSRSMETWTLEDPDDEWFFSGDMDGDGISEVISIDAVSTTSIAIDRRKWNPDAQTFDFCGTAVTQSGLPMGDLYKTLRGGGFLMHASHGRRNSLVLPHCEIDNDGDKVMVFHFPFEGVNLSVEMKGHSEAAEQIPFYTLLDADRNGLDDIFLLEKEKDNGMYPAYLISYDLTTGTCDTTQMRLNLQGVPDRIRCADFNSDGMADLLVTTTGGYYIYWNRSGIFSDSDRYYGTAFGQSNVLEAGDFDGDGLVDLIVNTTESYWYIARNTGNETNGYFSLGGISDLVSMNARQYAGKEDKLYCLVQDIDGDGKSDAIVGYPHNNGDGGCICILRSDGSTLTLSSFHHLSNSGNFPDVNHIMPGNFDGHGGLEILYWGRALEQSATGWHMLQNPSLGASSQKMVAITDGLGARDSICYSLLTEENVYSVTRHHSFPLIPMAGGVPVVTSRIESIPSESRTTGYSYANGFLHLQGKGFLGFEDIRAASSTGTVTDTHCKTDTAFYVLLPHTISESRAVADTVIQDCSTISLQGAGYRSYTTNNIHHETRKLLEGFSEGEDSEYFEYGFPTYQKTESGPSVIEKDITYWESPLDSVRLKGLPEEIEVTKSWDWIVVDEVSARITYERDPSTGLVLKETRRRNGQLVSTDGYAYNEYGQMTLHYTVPYSSTDTLVSRYEYYADNGKLHKEYDPKGLTRTYNYNSQVGTLLSFLDFDGVMNMFQYDPFFRETQRKTPIESLQTTRALSSYGGSVYSIKETKTGEAPVTTYYDAWERKVAESSPLANGAVMYRDYRYLTNGKVGFVSFPHGSSQPTQEGTTYNYDYADRLASTEDSNGKMSTWGYGPQSVTSCIDGITTTTHYYSPDKVQIVEYDDDRWVEYLYNADTNISTINSYHDTQASYEYDTYGRLIRTTDMNGVTKEYSYDINGHPYRKSVAGSILETNYDKYGILRSKSWTEPGETAHTVNYTYDSKFRLSGEAGNSYHNSYAYDQYGRMTQKHASVTYGSTKQLDVNYHYDTNNHIDSTVSCFNTVPSMLIKERYSYRNGYKVSDMLKDSVVWSLVTQDRWGNVTKEIDSLGITTYSFDDYGNMLSMNRSGDYPVSESYAYNVQTGNMTGKNDTIFSYDSMNRLTGWGNRSYTYDDRGNITGQPFVGTFSYDGYRVSGMTADSSYVIDDSLRITYYKAIERPKSIQNANYRADFSYDGNGNRYMMKVYKKQSGRFILHLVRYYLDANAELTDDAHEHYTHLYYAGGDAYTAPAVMVMDRVGNSSIYQITRDNIGSVLQYENAAGDHCRYSYSPWGVRTHQVWPVLQDIHGARGPVDVRPPERQRPSVQPVHGPLRESRPTA